MATLPLDPPEIATEFWFGARVGAASWSVRLLPCAVAALELGHGPTEPAELPADTWFRIMDSVRAKAVRLRWYGGGEMTIAGEDLVQPTSSEVDDDGIAVSRPAWFEIIGPEASRRASLHLVA